MKPSKPPWSELSQQILCGRKSSVKRLCVFVTSPSMQARAGECCRPCQQRSPRGVSGQTNSTWVTNGSKWLCYDRIGLRSRCTRPLPVAVFAGRRVSVERRSAANSQLLDVKRRAATTKLFRFIDVCPNPMLQHWFVRWFRNHLKCS